MAIYPETKFTLKDGRTVLIRSPKETDVVAMHAFRRIVSVETTFTSMFPGQPDKDVKRFISEWKEAAETKGDIVLHALDGNRIVGEIAVFVGSQDHPWTKHTASFGMFIIKEFWNAGLGSRFMDIVIDNSRKSGVKRLEGEVDTKNIQGISLYLKKGFVIEGLRRNVALINGEWQDEYSIAKFFEF